MSPVFVVLPEFGAYYSVHMKAVAGIGAGVVRVKHFRHVKYISEHIQNIVRKGR